MKSKRNYSLFYRPRNATKGTQWERYSFECDGKQIEVGAYRKDTAIRVFQNILLASCGLGSLPPKYNGMELRLMPVKEDKATV